ncbi:MAG: division/cell wall cluster transcriptional repressor MraZ [Gemmatimonadota bacterium]
MDDADHGSRVSYLGSFVHSLDDKGRVSLPAAYRKGAAEARFVLAQVQPPSLVLYPESTWVTVEERLKELVRRRPETRLWVLSTMANAVEVLPDSQGRILIPARLQDAATLDGQVQLIGAIDRIELWNPSAFEKAVREDGQDFGEFTPQIFL